MATVGIIAAAPTVTTQVRGNTMAHGIRASRLMGLFVLAAGLLTFSVTEARAEPGALWLVNGSQISEGLLPTFNSKKDSSAIAILFKIGISTIEFSCTKNKYINGLLHTLGRATGKLHLDGCITKINGNESAACKPHSAGAELGLVETNSLNWLLKLHILKNAKGEEIGRDELIELKALPIATLELGTGMCAIGTQILFDATLFLKDCANELLTDKLEHLLEVEKSLTELFLGGNPGSIDGSFWMALTGVHAGMTWGGHV